MQFYPPEEAAAAARDLARPDLPVWETTAAAAGGEGQVVTWYVAGTLPGWDGSPLALAVLIERDDPDLARRIGQALFEP